MQQVKGPGAGEERRYGEGWREWEEKQISFPACLPQLVWLRGEGGLRNRSERGDWWREEEKMWEWEFDGESGEAGQRRGGPEVQLWICEREKCEALRNHIRELGGEASTKKADGWSNDSGAVKRWDGLGKVLRISSPGCFTEPPAPLLSPFELWLLLLPANSFSSLPPSVRADSTDTQCFVLSNSWQSVHHTPK